MTFLFYCQTIKTADSSVKIYACKKATNISIKNINNTNSTDIGDTNHPDKASAPLSEATNIRDIKLNIII